MCRYALTVVLTTAFLFIHSGECPASVTGKVTDTGGNPVSEALVTFIDESDLTQHFSAYTDLTGSYTVDTAPVFAHEEEPVPSTLGQNYPNPFNPTTTIPFSLERSGPVSLTIYTIMGQTVRTLIDGYYGAGNHSVIWNGLDRNGESVSAGVYLYQLRCGRNVESRKMLLLDGGGAGNTVGWTTPFASKTTHHETTNFYMVTVKKSGFYDYRREGVDITGLTTFNIIIASLSPHDIQGITFVPIPGGTFEMGDEYGDLWNECRPVHEVTVTSLEMSAGEITNLQYSAFLNEVFTSGEIRVPDSESVIAVKGEWKNSEYMHLMATYPDTPENECLVRYRDGEFMAEPGYEDLPVTWVTWYGAKAFAQHYGFDLPTEAEWEYACRGGKQYKYGTANGMIDTSKLNYLFTGTLHPLPAGSYPSNPFGLYDMSGNLAEWCNDWYGDYPFESVTDPEGPQYGIVRIIRGGSWLDYDIFCWSASRFFGHERELSSFAGFRVVRRPGGIIH